jgi:hypothetical protein
MPRVPPPLPFSLAASRVWQPFSSNHHLLLVSGDASKAAEMLIKIILFCGGVFENPFSIQFQRASGRHNRRILFAGKKRNKKVILKVNLFVFPREQKRTFCQRQFYTWVIFNVI